MVRARSQSHSQSQRCAPTDEEPQLRPPRRRLTAPLAGLRGNQGHDGSVWALGRWPGRDGRVAAPTSRSRTLPTALEDVERAPSSRRNLFSAPACGVANRGTPRRRAAPASCAWVCHRLVVVRPGSPDADGPAGAQPRARTRCESSHRSRTRATTRRSSRDRGAQPAGEYAGEAGARKKAAAGRVSSARTASTTSLMPSSGIRAERWPRSWLTWSRARWARTVLSQGKKRRGNGRGQVLNASRSAT